MNSRYFYGCFALAACCSRLAALASTNYVATTGSDANPGTLAEPWRTVQKAADTLKPGDVALVRGGVYNERVSVNVSGSAAEGPVVFQNFPDETPVLDGTGLTAPSGPNAMWMIRDRGFVTVEGFEIRNYRSNRKNIIPAGIFIAGTSHDVEIRSNRVHHIETNYRAKNGGDAFGLAVYGASAAHAISNVVIHGNEIFSLKTGSSESMALNGNVTDFVVSDNRVHDNNNIGIDFIGHEGVCAEDAKDRARHGVCRGNAVWNISSHGNPAYGQEYSSDGIYCDGSTDIVVESNRVFACDLGIELASEHHGKNTSFITARDNVVWSNRVVGIQIGGYDAKRGRTEFCRMERNILYHNDTLFQGNGEWRLEFDTRSNRFTQNVVVAHDQNLLISNAWQQNTRNVVDWNLYFAPGGAEETQWQWKKKTFTGFARYQSATGNDAHSVFADPKFADPDAGDFQMTMPSPDSAPEMPGAD